MPGSPSRAISQSTNATGRNCRCAAGGRAKSHQDVFVFEITVDQAAKAPGPACAADRGGPSMTIGGERREEFTNGGVAHSSGGASPSKSRKTPGNRGDQCRHPVLELSRWSPRASAREAAPPSEPDVSQSSGRRASGAKSVQRMPQSIRREGGRRSPPRDHAREADRRQHARNTRQLAGQRDHGGFTSQLAIGITAARAESLEHNQRRPPTLTRKTGWDRPIERTSTECFTTSSDVSRPAARAADMTRSALNTGGSRR